VARPSPELTSVFFQIPPFIIIRGIFSLFPELAPPKMQLHDADKYFPSGNLESMHGARRLYAAHAEVIIPIIILISAGTSSAHT